MAKGKEGNSTTLRVTVLPNAPENRVVGFQGEALKVKVTAPPTGGKANLKLIEVLAERLSISRSNIEIIHGHTCRNKVLRIWNVSRIEVRRALKNHL